MNPQRKFHEEIISLAIAYVKIHSYEKLASQREAFCRTLKLNAGTLPLRRFAAIPLPVSGVAHRVVSFIITITLLYYIWFSRNDKNCSRFNDNSYDNSECPR